MQIMFTLGAILLGMLAASFFFCAEWFSPLVLPLSFSSRFFLV